MKRERDRDREIEKIERERGKKERERNKMVTQIITQKGYLVYYENTLYVL